MFLPGLSRVNINSLLTYLLILCYSACRRGRYGEGCVNNCSCDGDGRCDSVTGRCLCGLGRTGARCQDSCRPGRYGPDCSAACRCRHAAVCHPVTGSCDCSSAPGWYGPLCQLGQHYSPLCRFALNLLTAAATSGWRSALPFPSLPFP